MPVVARRVPGAGRIHAAGRVFDVTFDAAAPDQVEVIEPDTAGNTRPAPTCPRWSRLSANS